MSNSTDSRFKRRSHESNASRAAIWMSPFPNARAAPIPPVSAARKAFSSVTRNNPSKVTAPQVIRRCTSFARWCCRSYARTERLKSATVSLGRQPSQACLSGNGIKMIAIGPLIDGHPLPRAHDHVLPPAPAAVSLWPPLRGYGLYSKSKLLVDCKTRRERARLNMPYTIASRERIVRRPSRANDRCKRPF